MPFSVLSAVVILLAAFSQFTGLSLKILIAKALVKPEISCSMEYPVESQDDKVFRNTRNPEIVISNKGPIRALSVSVDVEIYNYDYHIDKIVSVHGQGEKSFDHIIAREELKPFDEIRFSSAGSSGDNLIAVYVVSVVYHIEPDMERFILTSHFFAEGSEIKDEEQFKRDERYKHIAKKLKVTRTPSEGGLVVKYKMVNEHTIFVETENCFSTKKDLDGKVLFLELPRDQEETKVKGYPFLEITPHPLKDNGLFYETEIVDDHIEMKTKFAIINSGDTPAMMTENGFDITKIIKPGQTQYYYQNIVLRRGEDNKETLENIIKEIHESKEAIQTMLKFNYLHFSDEKKFFKVERNYYIGNYGVTEIQKGTDI